MTVNDDGTVHVELGGQQWTLRSPSLLALLKAERAGFSLDDDSKGPVEQALAAFWILAVASHPEETVETLAERISLDEIEELSNAVGAVLGKERAAAETSW